MNKKKIGDKTSSIMSNMVIGMSIYQSVKLDTKSMHEIVFFVDDENIDINNNNYDYNIFIQGTHSQKTKNKILALTLSTNYLFIARSFGYLWSIDVDENLRIHNIKYPNEEENKKIENFVQKEVWEIEWCHKREDYDENFNDTLSFVTIEKNRLLFYTNLHRESEPYICTYSASLKIAGNSSCL